MPPIILPLSNRQARDVNLYNICGNYLICLEIGKRSGYSIHLDMEA